MSRQPPPPEPSTSYPHPSSSTGDSPPRRLRQSSSRTGSPLPSNGGERRGWAGPAAGPSSPRLSPGPEYRAREGVDRARPVSGHMLDDMRRNGSSDSLRARGGSGLGLPPINTSHLHPSTSSSGAPYGHQGAGGSNSSSPATSPRLPPAENLSQHYPSPHQHQHPTGASSSSSHNSLSHNSGLSQKPHWYPSPAPSPTTRSPALGSTSSHPDRSNSGDSSASQPGGEPRPSEKPSGRSGGGSSREGGALVPQACASCHLPMTGQFVRALGTVYHLDCFRCQDCSKVVASKFFPVDASDGSGRQYPLCETDYFRRLGLLCSKCGAALRGSYITALDMKFHVEHFTCSVCPTVFGPQDSYYEHAGSVYCHFHYSTRFAVKCTGCRTAILKQFVEINRNSTDEHWHPECYMIMIRWNIKLAPSPPVILDGSDTLPPPSTTDAARPVESSRDAMGPPSRALEEAEYLVQEQNETSTSLKERQKVMEEQVYRIWTVLSAFEESSAACISEMLRHVSSGQYVEGVRMAEKFVLHVETLFSAIDDLSVQFKQVRAKEISHVREARLLCKKVVNFFSLLSHTQETGARKMSITQELLSLVTGLAHYLKILIRIALTAALKLERDHGNLTAIGYFLSRLDRLARDPEASKFASLVTAGPSSNGEVVAWPRVYGYKGLTRAVGTLVGQGEATTDLCEGCKLTVEEECARFGTSLRWHLPCLRCVACHKTARKERELELPIEVGEAPTAYYKDFRIEPITAMDDGRGGTKLRGGSTFCSSCTPEGTRDGCEYVTRLEQYAFLLCVALNKLYALLKQRGAVPSSPVDNDELTDDAEERSLYDAYRDSADIKRLKSVNLDRKLSSTTAQTPRRSTVIQSPSGRVAQPTDSSSSSTPHPSAKPPIPSRKDQPLVDSARGITLPRPSPPSTLPKSYRSLPSETTLEEPRPYFQRATTAVRIVDEQSPDLSSAPHDNSFVPTADSPSDQIESPRTMDPLPTSMARYSQARTGMLLSELSALEYFIVKHVAALMLAADTSPFRDVAPLDDLLDIIDARKNTFWGKLFKGGNNDKKNVKKKGVFGIALDVLVERNGADSMHGAGPGSLRVPSFVDDVVSAMKQMDMSVEGVFRKNGNIRRLKDLCEALDRDAAAINLSDENPVQLAALLKRFLRDLPDPLMTFKLFHLFIASQRIEPLEERKKIMHLICCLLPKPNRDTMEALFVFLKWVASFSHVDEETGSKMDLHNLATVICPNILYAKGKDPYKDESFSAVRAVHELLEYQDEFWVVPEEFATILSDQDLFANPSQITSKEILARAASSLASTKTRKNSAPTFGTTTRGEVHPQRPDLQQAWSAPAVARPGNASPRGFTGEGGERPVSFSTFAPTLAQLGASSGNRPNQPMSSRPRATTTTTPPPPLATSNSLGPHILPQFQQSADSLPYRRMVDSDPTPS